MLNGRLERLDYEGRHAVRQVILARLFVPASKLLLLIIIVRPDAITVQILDDWFTENDFVCHKVSSGLLLIKSGYSEIILKLVLDRVHLSLLRGCI